MENGRMHNTHSALHNPDHGDAALRESVNDGPMPACSLQVRQSARVPVNITCHCDSLQACHCLLPGLLLQACRAVFHVLRKFAACCFSRSRPGCSLKGSLPYTRSWRSHGKERYLVHPLGPYKAMESSGELLALREALGSATRL
jgi:hypothetical protein